MRATTLVARIGVRDTGESHRIAPNNLAGTSTTAETQV